jgi:RNAse (barnase) inhibitor barstar
VLRRFLKPAGTAPAAHSNGAAPFKGDAADRERLDWKLLESGAVVLYHKPQVLTLDQAWLTQAGYRIDELDAVRWTTGRDFHTAVKAALEFPDYYSHNLASLVEALSEMPVPNGGRAVVIKHYDAFARAESELAQNVLDAIETTSRRFLLVGRRLLALIQSDDPRIRFERVGAMPVNWNPREWLDGDRGVGIPEK